VVSPGPIDGFFSHRSLGLVAHPGDPSAAVYSEGEMPCWFQRLVVLVGLEKSGEGECIDDAEREQKEQHALSTGPTAWSFELGSL